ncbi:hypothetical protein Acsp03_63420 [Actinomadura sp. NBRC 104412]|nr:hypothetical protein Acsp03_63420 [Actinomadura sp. NBRC 104412]
MRNTPGNAADSRSPAPALDDIARPAPTAVAPPLVALPRPSMVRTRLKAPPPRPASALAGGSSGRRRPLAFQRLIQPAGMDTRSPMITQSENAATALFRSMDPIG